MASSSLSSSKSRPNEVFLSFRGEDTRNNFVSHLYSALNQRGIRTYFDEHNLQKGQTIPTQLVKAIQESCIAIVVFSTNYASSTWCLNELLAIMESKNKSGLHVFPVFYDVDPSDVRYQKNSFFLPFSIHEVNFEGDAKMVKSWRKALTEVANLAGEDIRGKNEATCIKKISDKILRQLPVKASQFRKSLVGIESRISDIKKIICSKPNEVLFIGIWGMGGIGKTTTARAIYEDCKLEFEGSCFLQDVRQSKNRMKHLQKILLSNVLKTNFEDIFDVVEGTSLIQERLQFKKVLLVIDDVDDIEQLNVLAKQCGWFGRGSRIIITSRDKHLLNDVHMERYDVQTLPENEALQLLCVHAFKNDHPPVGYKELSLQVLRYAGGLPLALQVLGDHLYLREKCIWKSTLSRLKDVPEDKIISKLLISFDGLHVLQQNIFLDIDCFFRGYTKGSVEERLESLGLHPKEGIHVLIQKSLIHTKDDLIEMHDLFQEMGWYIVRQRANFDVRRYSRLWLNKDIVGMLSDITVSSEVEGICMTIYANPGDDFTMRYKLGWEGALRNMNKLRFLELCQDFFDGNYDVNFSHSLGQLEPCSSLLWFSWSQYPGQSLPKSFHLVNLLHLHMEFSQIEETPDFSHMPNLEVVNLSYSDKLVHVHSSLGDHMKVKRINLLRCSEVEEFPKINGMKSLEILNLSFTKLKCFPEIYGNLDSLKKLEFRGTYINGIRTPIVGSATSLRKLKLRCYRPYKEVFRRLEVVAESFPRLVSLKLTGTGIVRTLDFTHLPYLEKLDLSGSEELEEVHASLGVNKRIKFIKLSFCSNLKEFPGIGDMDSLEELNLSHSSLQSFPKITGNVNRLKKLYLDATEIMTLPWSIGRATSLEIISIQDCNYLRTLPISILGLQFLKEIYIWSGGLLYFKENINDEAGVLQEVELHSRQRKRAKQIVPHCMGQLSATQIYFKYCISLDELPDSLLSRVKVLFIMECPTLSRWICFNLVDVLDKYQHLHTLQLHEGSELRINFFEWELMSNMFRKRQEFFKVYLPGSKIPSWFQYEFSRESMTVFLSPLLSKWYTDELRGFVLGGINADLTNNSFLSKYDDLDDCYGC